MSEFGMHRRDDPNTSVNAANSVKVAKLEQIVFDWLKSQGERGGTTEEISNALNISRVTISPRMKPLKKKNLITESTKKRKGSSNRYSIVWVVIGKNTTVQGQLC